MTDSERAMEERAGQEAAPRTPRLKDALRQARIEMAERSAVVVDLRDAEIARLEMLSEALDSIFEEIPAHIDLFDRGIVPGDPPRLWIDMIAHVVMGRDKRLYRFLQDTRYGRRVLMESNEVAEVAAAVTSYVARRLVERERMLAADPGIDAARPARPPRPRRAGRLVAAFLLGLLVGAAALFVTAWYLAAP